MSEFFAANLGARPGKDNVFDWARLIAAQPETESWSVPEAFVAVLFAAVTCDDALAAIEHETLLALAHRSRALKSLAPAELGEINVKIAARLREQEAALREACEALPTDMRAATFAHALDLVLADGELNQDEADFLNAIVQHLGLAREDVERIADVIAMKNRF